MTAIYPPDMEVVALFDTLASAVQCTSKKECDLLAAASALMSTYFSVMEIATSWLEENGLERSKARPPPLCSKTLPDAQARILARALPS